MSAGGSAPPPRRGDPLPIVAGVPPRPASSPPPDDLGEADPARLAQGWERRFIAQGARLDEMMRLYEALGYEVAADPVSGGRPGVECEGCRLATGLGFKLIYTRSRRTS
ncbi:MAG TPA: hypothetical protein VFK69_12855 [Candidatus Eisenbacteria bacterium]|nr:hypothetical protein [Candidatus Eisenbacteria bacterium]